MILMETFQDLTIILPIITFFVGVVFTKLWDLLLHRLKRKEETIDNYRKLLENYLDDYIAPLNKILLFLGMSSIVLYSADAADIEGYSSKAEYVVNKFYSDLISLFWPNYGLFNLILPSKLNKNIGHVISITEAILKNFKKDKIDHDLLLRMPKIIMPVLDGFREVFGLESVDRFDKKIKNLLTSKEIIPELIELIDEDEGPTKMLMTLIYRSAGLLEK